MELPGVNIGRSRKAQGEGQVGCVGRQMRKAARAMGDAIGQAILLSRSGESFQLSSMPIWVRPIATALAVRGEVSNDPV